MWQEGIGEKDFSVLCDPRSRYVERNDNNDDIHIATVANSKFLWSEIFVIHAILP